MIKHTIATVLAFVGFVAPFAVRQEPPTLRAQDPVVLPSPSVQRVVTLDEVVITVPAPKKAPAVTKRARVWTCGPLQESQVGGSYRACEWR